MDELDHFTHLKKVWKLTYDLYFLKIYFDPFPKLSFTHTGCNFPCVSVSVLEVDILVRSPQTVTCIKV